MIFKSAVAAGLLAAAVAVAPQAASAKTTINVGIGAGGGWAPGYQCNWANNWCHPRPGWNPGPGYYYNPGPVMSYGPPPARRMSCATGARVIWNHGYNNVHALSCGRDVLVYDATRYGRHWRLRINAWTGRMI